LKKRVTYNEFRAWLKSFRPRQIVGTTARACDCPLARYTGYRATYTHDGRAYLTPTNFHSIEVAKLPRWAYRFMLCIDNCGVFDITAGRALKFLEECR